MKKVIIVALTFIAAFMGSCKSAQQSPNFIVIFSDDQSWVGTSFMGNPDDPRTKSDYFQTPNMERLAQMGMQFTDGYSAAPYCCPSRKSLLTGLSPAKHEYQQDRENWTVEFRKNLTIPQVLKGANPRYQTAHFGKWDARYDEVTPEEMGYDYSDGLTTNGTGGGRGAEWPMAIDDPKLIFDLTERSCRFMEQQVKDGNPFYLQVSHYAVHLGMFYTEESIKKYKGLEPGVKHKLPEFAAMTGDLDTGIGMLLDKIEELELMDNTYVIFLSDNGGRTTQPLGEEAQLTGNFPLREGKGTMYEGGIRVPFVVIGPDVKANSVSNVPVSSVDILPTLADISAYSGELPEKLDGGSIADVIRNEGMGKVQRNNSFLVFHQSVDRKAQSALREGDFKLLKNWEDNQLELFNLSTDLSEEHNLADEMPEKTAAMNAQLEQYLLDAKAETKRIPKKERKKYTSKDK